MATDIEEESVVIDRAAKAADKVGFLSATTTETPSLVRQ